MYARETIIIILSDKPCRIRDNGRVRIVHACSQDSDRKPQGLDAVEDLATIREEVLKP